MYLFLLQNNLEAFLCKNPEGIQILQTNKIRKYLMRKTLTQIIINNELKKTLTIG